MRKKVPLAYPLFTCSKLIKETPGQSESEKVNNKKTPE